MFYFITSRGWSTLTPTGNLYTTTPPTSVLEAWKEAPSARAFYYAGWGGVSEVRVLDEVPARDLITRAEKEYAHSTPAAKSDADDVVVPGALLWVGGFAVFFVGVLLGSATGSVEHHYHGE